MGGGPGGGRSWKKCERSEVGGSPIGAVHVEANISRFFFRLPTLISYFFNLVTFFLLVVWAFSFQKIFQIIQIWCSLDIL